MDTLPENIITEGEKNVTYKVEGREEGHAYLSDEGKSNEVGLVLIQEWWGLNKSITITADTFAKQGFNVISPDIYRGKQAKDREEAGHLLGGLDFKGAAQDIIAAGNYLRTLGCKKVGVTGFCMGGALAIFAIAQENSGFDACVPFYGIPTLSYINLSNINVPVLAHFGTLDDHKGFSDPEAAKNLEIKAKEAGVNFTLHMWEGGNHAFMNQDSKMYNSEIAEQAIKETTEFLKKTFSN